eukprot:TRINITY_DN2116_c0_g2_i4.p1 TRINITY_DN2116_c0_g2~~TRINITY_DN2116_c0_g2_i4.p1  ORF type:complete len:467 (+),score=64.22 TRINITY_DN2116_c0_g2_i4:202-1602(+)
MEYFGQDLTNLIKAGVKWEQNDVDALVRFMIRALRMMKQRGILHGDIKPHNIVSDGQSNFKMIDFDNSGFHRSSSTATVRGFTEDYASKDLKMKLAQNVPTTAEDWRRNDLHCTAITILQVIYGWTTEKLKEYRGNESSLRTDVIDQIANNFPGVGLRLKETIVKLMEGVDIDTIAEVYDDTNPTLSHEDFGVFHSNHKEIEDDVIRLMKSKIANDEISKMIAYIVKGVDLDFVKKALLSPPKVQTIQSEQQQQQPQQLQQHHHHLVPISSTSNVQKLILDASSALEQIRLISNSKLPSSIEINSWQYYFKGNVNEGCKTILKSLTPLHSLIHLTLDFNSTTKLNDEGCKHVGDVVNHFSSTLTTLHLNFRSCKQITDTGVEFITSQLPFFSILVLLHFDFTHCAELTDRSVENIVNGIRSTQLSLLLVNLQLSDRPIASLTHNLRNLTLLSQLSIGWCSTLHHHL